MSMKYGLRIVEESTTEGKKLLMTSVYELYLSATRYTQHYNNECWEKIRDAFDAILIYTRRN